MNLIQTLEQIIKQFTSGKIGLIKTVNSYIGSFTASMVLNTVDNYQVYRVNLSPLPIGSPLNNHGQLLF